MRWKKLGRVFAPDGRSSWARHSALTPTPWRRDEDTIRVFAGLRDDEGVSRIGYVDVDARDPTRVLRVGGEPALDIGRPGAFDDNGVILGDVLERDGALLLYYVGFQQVRRAKFLAFTGLARSADGGASFQRVQEHPVLDRSDEGLYIRAAHTARVENGVVHLWYAAGDGWEQLGGTAYPRYHIRHLTSLDGRTFGPTGDRCVDCEGDEYRIGRPRVYGRPGAYELFYTRGTRAGAYLAGYARSTDGVTWQRRDEALGLAPSPEGWDSRALSYPALLESHGKTYAFYNGNDMGKTGFGVAELLKR